MEIFMKKVYIGALATITIVLLILAGGKFLGKENIREKYPYIEGNTQEFAELMDAGTIENWELDTLIANKDMAMEGTFIGEPEAVEVAIIPEEGTNEYTVTQSLAEEFGKTVEEMAPKVEYYKIEFSLNNILYHTLENELAEKVSVYIDKGSWEVFPDPIKYQKAILFADDFPYGGEHAVLVSSLGYYYISDKHKVYSAEKIEGLDKYSGESVENFSKEVIEVQNSIFLKK
jgi:hypothetical protein